MKRILAFATAVLMMSGAQSQIQDSGQHGLMTLTTKKNENLSEVKGTPYMQESFKSGVINMVGKKPLAVFLRYDVLNENIEIKTDLNSNEVFVLSSSEKAEYKIGDKTFVHKEITHEGKQIEGFFVSHYEGKNLRLIEKPKVTVTEAVKARTGYEKDQPAEIKIESEYYVVKERGKTENLRLKHRDIKKTFNSPEAKKYLSDNRIKSLEDLIAFVNYLDKK